MATPRRRAPLTEGLKDFVADGVALRLVLGRAEAEGAATVARTALELAVATQGAAVVLTARPGAGAAFRGAREAGLEPRILTPGAGPGLSARAPLSLALQGDRALPAFAEAAGLVADFVAQYGGAPGALAEPALRAGVVSAVARARDNSELGLDFGAVLAQAKAALGRQQPLLKKAEEGLRIVEAAEAAARTYGTPVPWASLAGPSPAGRRAGVFLDLSLLAPEAAAKVEGLTLASLAASTGELRLALGGAPLFLVADEPSEPLGRFAMRRLASWGEAESPAFFALFFAPEAPRRGADLPEVEWGPGPLPLPGRPSPLPQAQAPLALEALTDDEVRALTPPAMRARLLGGAEEAEDETGAAALMDAPSKGAGESFAALKDASGDLEAIARKRQRLALKPPSKREGAYEASDFELE